MIALSAIKAGMEKNACSPSELHDPSSSLAIQDDFALVESLAEMRFHDLAQLAKDGGLDERISFLIEDVPTPKGAAFLLKMVMYLGYTNNLDFNFCEAQLVEVFRVANPDSVEFKSSAAEVVDYFDLLELLEVIYWINWAVFMSGSESVIIDSDRAVNMKPYLQALAVTNDLVLSKL